LPLALFIDGVSYSQVDTAIGFWFVNLITGARYLVAVLRKALLCECGCKGWCSLAEVFSFIHWSLKGLSEGVFPSRRHDGREFRASDRKRAEVAGQPLQGRAALLCIKGDWSEYAHSFGFPSWNDGLRPCFACNCSKDNMMHVEVLMV